MPNHSEIVAGRPAEEKQLIHASQTAAHKTLSAPGSTFSFCNVTDRAREEVGIAYAIKTWNTCCFVPCGKHTSACISKAVMAASKRSNHFGTRCIYISRDIDNNKVFQVEL
jgi:hypothetical protein